MVNILCTGVITVSWSQHGQINDHYAPWTNDWGEPSFLKFDLQYFYLNILAICTFTTLFLRLCEGQLQPGEIKAKSCLRCVIPLCYTTRWALAREALLCSHLNDFVVGHFPNVCWPSKEQIPLQQSCPGKHSKNHAFVNVFTICSERF